MILKKWMPPKIINANPLLNISQFVSLVFCFYIGNIILAKICTCVVSNLINKDLQAHNHKLTLFTFTQGAVQKAKTNSGDMQCEANPHRRDGAVVRASASQAVNLEFIPLVVSYQKTLKNGIQSFPAGRSA